MLALMGGVIIGISTTLNLFWYGRITGMSGMFNSLIKYDRDAGFYWKFCFVAGLILVPCIFYYSTDEAIIKNGEVKIRFFDSPEWT